MSITLLVLLIVAGLLFLVIAGWGIFWLLVQAGVIVRAAVTPPTTDTNNYSLGQGREVKGEDQ
jgi:hypothetical protein